MDKLHTQLHSYLSDGFTFIIILFPILSIYGIGLGTFTLGDFALSLICIIALFETLVRKTCKISLSFLIFGLYIVIDYIFCKAFIDLHNDVLMRTMRYTFYIFVLALFVKDYFNPKIGLKIYYIISLLSICMMILQTLSWLFANKYIPGYLPGLPIMREELVTFSEAGKMDSLGLLRPRSFFGEPAHYCQYLLGTTCFILFNKKESIWIISLFAIGIILSISSTGILCLAFLLILYSLKNWKKFIIYFPIIIISAILIYNTDYIQSFITRMGDGKSTSDRFAGYSLLTQSTDLSLILFGRGMQTLTGEYLSGYMRLYYYFGIIGLLLFLITIFSGYLKHSNVIKILIWLFIILNIGTEVALGPFLLLFASFIITNDENRHCNLKLQRC